MDDEWVGEGGSRKGACLLTFNRIWASGSSFVCSDPRRVESMATASPTSDL